MNEIDLLKYLEEKHQEAMARADSAQSNWMQGFQCGRTNFAIELINKIKKENND